MIVVFRKTHLWKCVLLLCTAAGVMSVLWATYMLSSRNTTQVFSFESHAPVTWIIDAGHGGEDGGALSIDGITESTLNLSVALRLQDLMMFAGEKNAMTRTEDYSIHTEGNTIRDRKVSDIHNRVALVNQTENAVLLSIHQNSLPSSPITHGAQVFWNCQDGGEFLANIIQETLNVSINTDNEKLAKKIPDTIYLMKHITVPGILIECGFLSNQQETAALQTPEHQMKLAAAITAGCLRTLAGEETP